MKYESTILKRLIDTHGVVGNPRYISEIIKEFIVRGKERFPELFTYQADWLAHIDEFGLNPTYTVSYTGQSIYAPNTLERPVKSAILSGNTLVNLLTKSNIKITSNGFNSIDYVYPLDNTKTYIIRYCVNQLPELSDTSDSARAFKFEWYNGGNAGGHKNIYIKDLVVKSNVYIKIEPFSDDESRTNFGIWCPNYMSGSLDIDITLIEYQEGMENWDIPYFEGMQSVKMPVLTTSGKNLYSYGDLTINNPITNIWYYTNGKRSSFGSSCKRTDGGNWFYLEKGVYSYKSINENIQTNIILVGEGETLYDSGKEVPSGWYVFRFKTKPESVDYAKISQIQLEKDPNITTYEPFKSNILTTSEEVELRGIGDVKDELDCLTGEVIERIGEVAFDGSEAWGGGNLIGDTMRFGLTTQQYKMKPSSEGMCDKIPYIKWNSEDVEHIRVDGGAPYGDIIVWIKTSRLSTSDTQGFKQWLSQNPITVQYELATESVKTVDLTILDQNGQNVKQLMSFKGGTHFITRSSEGSPLPTVSVSVETDLEETLKMCSLDGNTM